MAIVDLVGWQLIVAGGVACLCIGHALAHSSSARRWRLQSNEPEYVEQEPEHACCRSAQSGRHTYCTYVLIFVLMLVISTEGCGTALSFLGRGQRSTVLRCSAIPAFYVTRLCTETALVVHVCIASCRRSVCGSCSQRFDIQQKEACAQKLARKGWQGRPRHQPCVATRRRGIRTGDGGLCGREGGGGVSIFTRDEAPFLARWFCVASLSSKNTPLGYLLVVAMPFTQRQ